FFCFFFFFQAEDGIRDRTVTGVQTCALPICTFVGSEGTLGIVTEITVKLTPLPEDKRTLMAAFPTMDEASTTVSAIIGAGIVPRSEERRVGKECRARWGREP